MDQKVIIQCRICLASDDESKMFDLFKENASPPQPTKQKEDSKPAATSPCPRLCEKVEYCCGVHIRESPDMPTKICLKCYDVTRIWFNFRQMAINSQVYLESLCKDRAKPPELEDDDDESHYLEYLLEDLQTFRAEARRKQPKFSIHLDEVVTTPAVDTTNSAAAYPLADSDKEADDDGGSAVDSDMEGGWNFEALPLDVVDADTDLAHIIKNIKAEQQQQDEAENELLDEVNEKTPKQREPRKSATKKLPPKKKFRASSPILCNICGNVYTKKSSFAYHMTLHANVRPHECELCGKSFRQVCELKNHMRRHTGEKPYKCSFCERHFIDRSEKHRHERVHTNTRPYICSVCGKSFMYSAILKNHSKLHSGEKEYSCLVCEKAFTLQHQLKAHLQTTTHKQKEAQYVSAGYEVVYE